MIILRASRDEKHVFVLNAVMDSLRLIVVVLGFLDLAIRLSLHSPVFFLIGGCIAISVFGGPYEDTDIHVSIVISLCCHRCLSGPVHAVLCVHWSTVVPIWADKTL